MSAPLARSNTEQVDGAQVLLDRLTVGVGLPRIMTPEAARDSETTVPDGIEALMRATTALARSRGVELNLDTRLLTERAALRGLTSRGRTAYNGASRLVQTIDGWVAISLPRSEDIDALPAWLGVEASDDPWPDIARAVALRKRDEVVESGQRLSVAVAAADLSQRRNDVQWLARGTSAGQGPLLRCLGACSFSKRASPIVIDLSALWAGPLCGHLLMRTGARVIKVESTTRPDGARWGNAAFYDLLNAGKESVALDFRRASDLAIVRRLIARADVVIESSRPRAFAQLGLVPATLFAENPGLTWVSITAYGRTGPWCERVGFGDDCAAAGGLLSRDDAGDPIFMGDAIADPLTGIAAAAGALASLNAGGGFLVDAALRETAAFVATSAPRAPLLPLARTPHARAVAMGQDTTRVLAEFAS